MSTRYYVVQVLRHWASVQVLGLPLSGHQYPGCIGFLPVFETQEQADAWREEQGHTNAGIAVIESTNEVMER